MNKLFFNEITEIELHQILQRSADGVVTQPDTQQEGEYRHCGEAGPFDKKCLLSNPLGFHTENCSDESQRISEFPEDEDSRAL